MEGYTEEYIFYLQNSLHKSENTIRAYERDLNKLYGFMCNHGVFDFEHSNFTILNSYVLYLENSGASTATISRNISVIKSFYNYLFYNKHIANNPALNIKAPKIIKKVPDILTYEEMEELLNSPDTNNAKGLRDKAMLELLYATGMKVTEIISLRIEDVNLTMKMVTCSNDQKGRMVPFGEMAGKSIEAYLQNGRPAFNCNNDYLFVNCNGSNMTRQGFWKIIKGYGKITGLEDKLTPHIFRNSFAAHMVRNGADLKAVQEMLGHADISTTQVYSSFAANEIHSVYEKGFKR